MDTLSLHSWAGKAPKIYIFILKNYWVTPNSYTKYNIYMYNEYNMYIMKPRGWMYTTITVHCLLLWTEKPSTGKYEVCGTLVVLLLTPFRQAAHLFDSYPATCNLTDVHTCVIICVTYRCAELLSMSECNSPHLF